MMPFLKPIRMSLFRSRVEIVGKPRPQQVALSLFAAFMVTTLLSGCPDEAGTPPESGSQTAPPETASPKVGAPEKKVNERVTVENADIPFEETESGLQYRILQEGDGHTADRGDFVICYYRGWLDDGTEFVNIYKTGESQNFPIGSMLPGFREAMKYVKAGGKIELIVPPELGFGEAGSPPTVPPDATLHFEIDVINTF